MVFFTGKYTFYKVYFHCLEKNYFRDCYSERNFYEQYWWQMLESVSLNIPLKVYLKAEMNLHAKQSYSITYNQNKAADDYQVCGK